MRVLALIFAVVVTIAACTPAWVPLKVGPTPNPSSSASASPSPGVLSVNPTSLSFFAAASQNVLVQETNFAGTLSETNTCSGIATINPSSSTSPYTAVVTPTAAGTCTITFTNGTQTVLVGVMVTAQSFVIDVQR